MSGVIQRINFIKRLVSEYLTINSLEENGSNTVRGMRVQYFL